MKDCNCVSMWVRLMLLLLVVFNHGCATTNPFVVAPNIGSQLPVDKGYLVMLVTNNSTTVNFTTLKLKRVDVSDDPNSYLVQSLTVPGSERVQFFSGELPPGRYRMMTFNRVIGNMSYWITLNEKKNYEFEIQSGKVSDLGRMIQTDNTGNTVLVFRANNEPSVLPMLKVATLDLYSTLTATDVPRIAGWDKKPEAQEGVWNWLSKFISRDFNNPIHMSNGNVVGGTRLGGALMRKTDGHWVTLDFKSNQPVQVVAELPGGTLFAGAELNRFFMYKPGGEVSTFSSEGLPFGKLVLARYYPQTGLILGVQTPRKLSLYHTRSIETPAWELLQSVDQVHDFFMEAEAIVTTATEKRIYIGQSSDLYVYDIESRQWTTHSLPFDIRDLRIEGGHWVALGHKLLSNSTYLSDDEGANWIKTETRSSDSIMRFVSATDAYVLSNDEGGLIKYSSDAGKTWYAYDQPKSDVAIPFAVRSTFPVVMLDDGDMLILEPSLQGQAGSAIYHYSTKEKKLRLERYVTIPILLSYLRDRFRSEHPDSEKTQ